MTSASIANRSAAAPKDSRRPRTGNEVAIVIPCFRQAHLLPDAVASAVNQTWPELHIVIVDDGSPDDTAAVAERLIAQHPARRITLVRQCNQGLFAARNAGVAASTSPFVLPLDADDALAPDAVERLLAALLAGAGDVATPGGVTFGDEVRPLRTRPVTRARLCANNCLVYASLFRRELFDRIGGYRPLGPGYEDWDFWLGALERGARFVHVDAPLFRYRKHGPTMLASADGKALRLHAEIVTRHPDLYPGWRLRLARRFLAAGGSPGRWARAGMLLTLLLDRRLRLFCRHAISRRATNRLSTQR
ncbi:MAG: glycosyltransferase family 2 protein [Planctomycetota bacterium]